MEIHALISKLNDLKIGLKLEGEQLKISASKESLTDDVLNQIKLHKKEITDFLKSVTKELSFESIQSQEYKDYYSLSSAQKRLYVLQKTEGKVVNYNLPIFLKFEGKVDVDKLKEVFGKLIQRHEMLRTSFSIVSGEVVQIIHKTIQFEIDYHEKKKEEINTVLNSFIRPFELEKVPLIRVSIIKIEYEEHVLLIDMHHIISDGISFKILAKELMDLYTNKELVKLKTSYVDYSEWQKSRRNEEYLIPIEKYWLDEFKTIPPTINLPYDFQRPSQFHHRGDKIIVEFNDTLKERIRHWLDSNKMSSFMFFFSIYNILLSKISGQTDIVVGIPIANRIHVDLENIIGMFVNTLAIRNYPLEDKTYIQFLNEIKEKSIICFENQEYQFDTLVEKLNIQREINRNPLFDVAFTMQNTDIPDIEMSGLKIKSYPSEFTSTKFDLTVIGFESNNQYSFHFEYNKELFKRETILQFTEYFKRIVTIVLNNSTISIKDIALLSENEKEKILSWCNIKIKKVTHKSIITLFYNQVDNNLEKDVVTYNGKNLSYKEIDNKSNAISNLLLKKGVKQNTLVGIIIEDPLEMIICLISVIKTGATFVTLNNNHNLLLQKIIKDSNINVIIKTTKRDIETNCMIFNIDIINYNQEFIRPKELMNDIVYGSISSERKNNIIFTLQEDLIDSCMWFEQNIYSNYSKNLNIATSAPINHNSFIISFFTALFNAHKLFILSDLEKGLSINTLSYLTKNKIDILQCLARELNEISALNENLFDDMDLKCFITEGGLLKKQNLLLLFGKINKLKIIHNYVVPEINQYGAFLELNENNIEELEKNTIGYSINNSIIITSPTGEPQSIGLKGNLCVRNNENWFRINNKKELYIKNNKNQGAFFKTSDTAKWLPDGRIEYCENNNSAINIGWDEFSIEEIKNCIENYPDINNAFVTIEKEGKGFLEIYYEAEKEITKEILEEYLKGLVYSNELLVKFIFTKKLPRLSNGIIDVRKIACKNLIVEEERIKIEEGLHKIWKKLLKAESIKKDDNFFSIGGNSLKVLMLVNEINKAFNKKLIVTDIYEHLTINDLSEFIGTNNAKNEDFKEIPRIADNKYYPVSSAQKRLYIIYELDKSSVAYNIPFLYEIKGNLDVIKIQKIFNALANRHDSLRTYFEIINDEPVQKVLDKIELKIDIYENDKDEEIVSTQNKLIKPFNLGQAPLIRIKIIKAHHKNYLFIDVHHIIIDATSVGILIDEFKKLYIGEELPILNLQYKDFAKWHNDQSEKKKAQEEYWLKEFSGELPIINLPTDYKRSIIKGFSGSNEHFSIDSQNILPLVELAQKEQTSLNTLFLTIFKIFLYKLVGNEDLIVGVPVGGREHSGLDNVVGMFLNTLPVRSYLSQAITFDEYFRQIKEKLIFANANQGYQLDQLINKLGIERDSARNPIFDVMLVFQEINQFEFENADIEIIPCSISSNSSKFDLTLFITKNKNNVAFNFEYSTELFIEETIKRFIRYFNQIVSIIIKNPSIRISEINLLEEKENSELLKYSTGIKKNWTTKENLVNWFEGIVDNNPEKTALIFKNHRVTYKELNIKSNQIASYLLSKGAKPNDIIGLMVERSTEMIICLIAIMKVRAAILPIDINYPTERKKYMIEDSKIKLLLTNLNAIDKEIINENLDVINIVSLENQNPNSSNLNLNYEGSDLIYVIYTSGSTGKPKGVMMHHKNLFNLIKYDQQGTSMLPTKMLQYTSISFDVSFNEILFTLLSGGELYLIDEKTRNDIDSLLNFIDLNKIETLVLPMSLLRVIFNDSEYINKMSKSVKHIMTAGEQVVISKMFKKYLKENNITLHNHYGPSETHVVTSFEIKPDGEIPELPSIGKPIFNTNIYILDKSDKIVPIGVTGEICISGAQVGGGYWQKSDLTSEKFILCPFDNTGLMYKTGDLAKWLPDGNIEFLGRIDKQLKIRGYRVEPGEVESQIIKYEGVINAVVIAKESSNKEKFLCAYLVTDDSFSISGIRGFLLNKLPDYMVPAHFVLVNNIPITPNGKIDFSKLPEPDIKATTYVAPENNIEKTMVELWAEVLGVDASKISVNADFFELGGHSLKATILISKIHKVFDIEMTLSELFRFSTIRELSVIMQQNTVKVDFTSSTDDNFEDFII